MKNKGLFSSLFIDELKGKVDLDDAARGRMATLAQTWRTRNNQDAGSLWESFLKQALGYLEFVPPGHSEAPGVYPLYEDWNFKECISILYLAPPGADIDDVTVGRFYPAKLIAQLKRRNLNWGILTNGSLWRLYSTQSSRPYEDYVELPLAKALEASDEAEYGLFERFFHKQSFIVGAVDEITEANSRDDDDSDENQTAKSSILPKCPLDQDRQQSEQVLEQKVKEPFLAQVDEVLQYICNGFIVDTQKSGEEYTEEERAEIFESAVKLIYRCLFLFYAEARRLLPTDPEKADLYRRHSIQTLCQEARKFRWGKRSDMDQYDLWKHLKGLINAVNDGDPEYGIMGYNGGLFDDEKERFLGKHQLRNDFLSRALYLLAFVEPYNNEPGDEYPIPYEDLEVRHLGELYENILEFTVQLADADRIRRRTKKGVEILLASQTVKKPGDTYIAKGEVFFGESALERKQTGSYYTAESLVRFLNEKSIVQPLRDIFEHQYRHRFNDFLEQAVKGHDAGTRRGAAQSAAALVERFTEQEVLNFKVCDPAMGSGHFLVDASNQMAGLVVSLLEEVPDVEGLAVSITSYPNYWRRRITRHCIYGIDLNQLAVNLSKLSLWLNCFASEHKLTFLDHHLRCGNSLIGIRSLKQLASIPKRGNDRKNNSNQPLLFSYDDLSNILANASKEISSITEIDEDDTDRQREVLQITREATNDLLYLADLQTAYLIDSTIASGTYKELFEQLTKGKAALSSLNSSLMEAFSSVMKYRISHHFFHWPLEFPDVFRPGVPDGFSSVVGNPPWDVMQPNTQEFYIVYDPSFRKYDKQEALNIIKQLHRTHQNIAEKWAEYEAKFQEASDYCKETETYTCLQKGKIDLYKVFLERFFTILKNGGYMGIVVPSGLYTDQGSQPLRELFFSHSRINFLYCFENKYGIFNIHRSFKFVLFGAQKGDTTTKFKCAFMEHFPEKLPDIDAKALYMSVDQVKKFSPDTLSIMEFKNQRDIDITLSIYNDHPLLGEQVDDSWNIVFTQEFNMTSDSPLFISKDQVINSNAKSEIIHLWLHNDRELRIGSVPSLIEHVITQQATDYLPLYEGKTIHEYDSFYSEPQYYIELNKGIEKNKDKKLSSIMHPKVVFRALGQSGNERNCIAAVLPEGCFTGNSLYYSIYGANFKEAEIFLFQSIFTSFTIDYLIRQKIDKNLRLPFIDTLPVPRISTTSKQKDLFNSIVIRSARLSCTHVMFSSCWNAVFSKDWQSPTFWYPSLSPIDNYGPIHEQEIRRRLRDEAKYLTPEWGTHCGVHDRLPDRRDTGDRAQLRAEIDAYVAHLYGLTKDDFAYILDTFPVLRRKEEKAFGEFMSKRKCLEEYNRIAKVLGK